jgi:hypothetical protein
MSGVDMSNEREISRMQDAIDELELKVQPAGRRCNKCGYWGQMETHNRPDESGVCGYLACNVEQAHSDVSVPRELLKLIDEAMCDFLGEDDPLLGDLRALLGGEV